MSKLDYTYNDGGRSAYFSGVAGDCVVRAIAIALDRDYKEVYDDAMGFLGYTPRNGINGRDCRRLMAHFHFEWHPLMRIGSGCTAHLAKGEIPMDENIVCSLSGHYVAVVNGVVNDLYDCTRDGKRCVYGYYTLKRADTLGEKAKRLRKERNMTIDDVCLMVGTTPRTLSEIENGKSNPTVGLLGRILEAYGARLDIVKD